MWYVGHISFVFAPWWGCQCLFWNAKIIIMHETDKKFFIRFMHLISCFNLFSSTVLEEGCGEVAFAGIGKEGDNELAFVFGTSGEFGGGGYSSA